jgi:hypothetical protein
MEVYIVALDLLISELNNNSLIVIEYRQEGGEWAESENYKLKHTLQVGVSVRTNIKSEREGKNKSTKK